MATVKAGNSEKIFFPQDGTIYIVPGDSGHVRFDCSSPDVKTLSMDANTRPSGRLVYASENIGVPGGSFVYLDAIGGDFTYVLDSNGIHAPRATGDDQTDILNELLEDASNTASPSRTSVMPIIFDNGMYVTNGMLIQPDIKLMCGSAQFLKMANGSGVSTNGLMRTVEALNGSTYYGLYDNIEIVGGVFSSNEKVLPANIMHLRNVRNLLLQDVTIQHTTQADLDGCWAFDIAGQGVRIINPRVLGGASRFQDGLHIPYGRDITVVGGYIESGDDAIALGVDGSASGNAWDDEGLTNVLVVGTVGVARRGSLVKIYKGDNLSGTYRGKVRGVSVQASGRSGLIEHCPVVIRDQSASPDSSNINDIKVDVQVEYGSAAHVDDFDPYAALWVSYASDVTVSVRSTVTDTTGGVARRSLARIADSQRVDATLFCSTVPAATDSIVVSGCSRVTLRPKLSGSNTTNMIALRSSPDTRIVEPEITLSTGSKAVYVDSGTTTTLEVINPRFYKASGATGTIGFDVINSTALPSVKIRGGDVSTIDTPLRSGGSAGNWHINVAAYDISGCTGINTVKKGVATLVGATLAVAHGCSINFPDSTTASIPMISITPLNALGTDVYLTLAAVSQFTLNGAAGASVAWVVDTGKKPV